MAVKWKTSKKKEGDKFVPAYPGVRYYEHPSRKHGVKFDRYLAIRYQISKDTDENDLKTGKKKKVKERREEGLGWTSERDPEDGQYWTEAKASLVLERLKSAAKHGKKEAPTRIAEQRVLEQQRKEAEKAAQEQAEKENITFSYYFEKVYFPTSKIGKKDETTRKEMEHFNKWIEPVIGSMTFKEIKPFAVEKIKKNILTAKKAPRTLQYVFATIRQTWNMARRDGLVSSDSPTKQVKVPKVDNKRIRFLSHKEADALLEALEKKDKLAHDLTLLSLHTGLRMGEMANLKWSHIDLDRGIIRVMDAKGGVGRVAYMTKKLKALYDGMKRGEPGDYVHTTKNGEKLSDMPRIYFEVLTELELNKGITDPRQKAVAHTLRHTFASWHVEAGTDLYTLKELMGHSVIAMTERYAHLSKGTLQNATKNLEQAIDHHEKNNQNVSSV